MTLEDFFTLTEMKNGLATLARVEELISMMQQQKDCVMSNVGDTARQWSSVASTLAATENEDCLNHFVQSNGLVFLNQWLQEALKCSDDFTDSTVEELMNALLGSLERLPVNREKLLASGIQITVEQLLGYKSLNINERARILSGRWNHANVNVDSHQDLKKAGTGEYDNPKPSADAHTVAGVHSVCVVFDISPFREGTEEGNCKVEPAGIETHHSDVTICPDSSQRDSADDVKTSTSNQIVATISLNSADPNANIGDTNTLPSSLVSNSCQESFSRTEESPVCPAVGMPSTGTCYCPDARRRDIDDHSNALVFKDVERAKEMKMEVDTKEGSPCKSDKKESHKFSSSSGLFTSSVSWKPERSVSCNFDSKENKSCMSETIELLPRSASVDCVLPKYLRTMALKPVTQDLSSNGCKLRKIDDPETSFHRNEDVESVSEVKEIGSECKSVVSKGVDAVIPLDFSETVDMKLTGEMEQESELGLEDGEIDALEVARQVAIEVEREVVDYREPFCSSSPEVNSGESMGAQSSDILEAAKQDQPVNKELNGNGSLAGKNLSDGAFSPEGDNLRTSETDIDPDKCEQNVEMPKPTTVAHESGGKSDRDICVDFDLNEDVCTEEFDCLMNPIPNNSVSVSAPIAVVAASKGAPLLPVTPLHFEGELGWKGSASTSAFRPACPRRTPDSEKTYSGTKRKSNFIEIDLNVAERGDDVAIDPISTKPIPVSSGFPSQESSMEVSSGRTDRLKLDLNRLGDEDVLPYPSSYQRLPHQNGDQTLSPATSSSSRQPSMRDFDLNDNPCFFDAIGSHNLSKSSSKDSGMYGSTKRDDPVITIMGSRMVTERKDYAHQARHSFMGSGRSIESTMAARPVLPYAHILPPAYEYNGLSMGPTVPFPPSLYSPGNISYMVDSRGQTVVPQILGSPVLNGAPSAVPPFFMSATNAPSSLNGAGQSHSGLDLNSGMMSMETGNREAGSLKHLFMQGHNGFMEGQVRTASQPAASGVSLKKKEPDSGWEPYAFGYKQVTSWQ